MPRRAFGAGKDEGLQAKLVFGSSLSLSTPVSSRQSPATSCVPRGGLRFGTGEGLGLDRGFGVSKPKPPGGLGLEPDGSTVLSVWLCAFSGTFPETSQY
jgi:hypothetical protein